MKPSSGILDRVIAETPIAVVDVETTGLSAGTDRILEIGVVRIEPGEEPELVLDTLVDPGRRVSATEIHGITDPDVKGAPRFHDLAPHFLSTISDCVFAAYNVYFDARFLQAELSEAGFRDFPPYLCLMYMRPMLQIGPRCTLGDACRQHRLEAGDQHVAADDALVSAQLWPRYTERMAELGVRTFRDLSRLRKYKFVSSFSLDPVSRCGGMVAEAPLKSRRKAPRTSTSRKADVISPVFEYWDALKTALADLEFTSDEIAYLLKKKHKLALGRDEMRWLHARAFSGILSDMSSDHRIDDAEAETLRRIGEGLHQLGWSPGDASDGTRPASEARGIKRVLARLRGQS